MSPEAIEARYDGAGYGKFKEEVGRGGRRAPRPDPPALRGAARRPAASCARSWRRAPTKAHAIAAATLARVHERVGFVPP